MNTHRMLGWKRGLEATTLKILFFNLGFSIATPHGHVRRDEKALATDQCQTSCLLHEKLAASVLTLLQERVKLFVFHTRQACEAYIFRGHELCLYRCVSFMHPLIRIYISCQWIGN